MLTGLSSAVKDVMASTLGAECGSECAVPDRHFAPGDRAGPGSAKQPGGQADQQASVQARVLDRYSRGLCPYCAVNSRLNDDGFNRPNRAATSRMGSPGEA